MRSARALITTTLALLSACGGDSGTGAAADPLPGSTELAQRDAEALAAADACSLLADDEVHALLGQGATGREEAGLGFDLACYWYAAGPNGMRREASVEVSRLEPEAALRGEYDTFKETMTFREDVSGVGAEAFLAQYGLSGSSLVIRTDSLLVFLNTTERDREAMLKQLGPGVLERLR
ncbi:MAG: DUF3558 family protein [Gammaproteobacteria bacterium]|nr:DUF3558 family protein [Gammaproteobacteria bacterium]